MQILAIPKRERIYAIAFSPSGRDLVAACGDGKIRVWDTTKGDIRHIGSLGEDSFVLRLGYLDDHTIVVDGRQWDLAANEWHAAIPGMPVVRQLALFPDGRSLVEVDRVQLTNTESGLAVWRSGPESLDMAELSTGMAFGPDGQWLATSHIVPVGEKQRSLGPQGGHYTSNVYDYVVRIRELPSCRTVKTISGWGQHVRYLTFSPDGTTLAGTAGPRLRIWDLLNDREVAIQKRGTKHFQGLAFTIDGRHLLTVSNDATVRMWDARTCHEVSAYEWNIGRLLNIAISPDGLRAAAGSDKGQIVIWDLDV